MGQKDQLSFADQEREARLSSSPGRASVRLRAIAEFVDWPSLEALLPRLDIRTGEAQKRGGRPRYSEPLLLRLLFLQYLYDLSDPELEDQVLDRSSFQEFAGITSSQRVPDFTTLWRFKEELARRGTLQLLFDRALQDLDARGLILRHGTTVDATVIETNRNRPLSTEERASLLVREQQDGKADRHTDSMARSTMKVSPKGKLMMYYGYKGHIGIDQDSRIIRRIAFSPANRQDILYYPELISGDEAAIYGDRAYQKQAHRREAETRRIDGKPVEYNVLRRANKHHALTPEDVGFNRRMSRVRWQVETVFAAMKERLSLRRTTAIGLERNRLRFIMNCLLYNIERSLYLLRST